MNSSVLARSTTNCVVLLLLAKCCLCYLGVTPQLVTTRLHSLTSPNHLFRLVAILFFCLEFCLPLVAKYHSLCLYDRSMCSFSSVYQTGEFVSAFILSSRLSFSDSVFPVDNLISNTSNFLCFFVLCVVFKCQDFGVIPEKLILTIYIHISKGRNSLKNCSIDQIFFYRFKTFQYFFSCVVFKWQYFWSYSRKTHF